MIPFYHEKKNKGREAYDAAIDFVCSKKQALTVEKSRCKEMSLVDVLSNIFSVGRLPTMIFFRHHGIC